MQEYVKALLTSAEENAEKIAVVDRGGTRSTDYRTFGDLMQRAAAWIHGKQLGERSFIPVRMDASFEYAAAVCGIWMAGHAAVPMGTSFPEERVKYISMSCEAPFIMDAEAMEEIRQTEPLPDPSVYPESVDSDVAFLLYTSGSTGMPKGILHSFQGLNANRNMGKAENYGVGRIWGMGAPMYFVASLLVYKILSFGGCVHLLDPATMRDVRKLEDYYAEHKIMLGFISPSVLSNFHSKCDALKVVMTGSERLTGQCSRDGYTLWNNYGMSETMGTVCSFEVKEPYDTTPVGIPPEGSVWALLDDDMNPVPDGQEGEFCAKGPYTLGYFKDPEATEKLYRGGWLHSGDILKKLPDGNLVYINRKDWMLKINGQRVEPGEIENVLRTVPGVEQAVVKGVKGLGDQVALCAYYTGEKLEDSFLSEKLGERLASYMIPGFYMHMEKFPINANGKIDRKNLPEPDLMARRAEYAPPENEIQSMLCRAFEDALGLEQIGIDDDFFDLGGDSIRVMKLAAACPELAVTSKMIYGARTPRGIAAECEKAGLAKKREKKKEYPLSSSQMGIYIESMSRDGEAAYNNPILLKLGEGIDMEQLRVACEAMVTAHPFIKMRLKTDAEGNPVQVRHDDESYSQTLEKMTETEFRGLVPDLMQPFRLLQDRLFRIRLFETEVGKYIFLDLHHIIFDGSSMLVLFRDLERAYRGGTLEIETYSGFEIAEDDAEGRGDEEAFGEAKKWYLDLFGGLEVDSLPIPDRNLGQASFGVVEKDLALEASEVEALCRGCGVTENIYATASFGLLLGLYAGMKESLFTTIYNGRDSLRTARTVAMLVKTLPVYARFEKEQTVREYLAQAKEQMLGCMNHDLFPFSQLVQETGMTSDLLFVYQGDVLQVGGFAGDTVERIPLMDNATGEQLAVQMYKQNGMYNVRAEYRSDLYSREFIEVLLRSFETVLLKMLREETVGEISPTAYPELEKLKQWNATETEYDRGETVVSLFRKAAEKYPGNVAVVYEDKELTYGEVDAASDRIAAYIRGLGMGRGDVVSILIPRGIYQVVASLGALKACCAYQPLDSTYPEERLNFMVGDASAGLLITTEELGTKITEYDGPRLTLEEIEALPGGSGAAATEKAGASDDSGTGADGTEGTVAQNDSGTGADGTGDDCRPEDTFILLYTSGSTGVPKGVRLTHGNLASFIEWYVDFYELNEHDRAGQYASYGFDACMMDMYPALSCGAAVVILPEEKRLDMAAMDEYYIRHQVSVAFITTQVGRQYAVESSNPYLRALIVGGEKLAAMDPPKGFNFYNLYGPTECTIASTVYQVTGREDNIPIGRPLGDVKCYVTDPFGHLLPPGALGELIVAGPHVGIGYLNRPEKTAEVFIENPYDKGEYAAAYKTGDIVRYRTDGEIEFIGRRDGQVKIHGFRIELSEVEAVLRDFPGIRDAAVVARDLGADGKAVAAYYVSDETIDPGKIAAFIRERKPPYMVPASLMQIEKIPVNQNGKVNKKALPEPVVRVAEEDTAHVDNVLEIALKQVIGEALNMENPPLGTPLEYLGFTSLSMIRLSTRLMKQFGVNLPVREMKDITIAGIEDRILEAWMQGGVRRTEDDLAAEDASVPLSAAQAGVYVECMKQPESTMYNIPMVLDFTPDTDPGKVADAVKQVLEANPSVFVHFDIVDDQVMAIRDEVKVPVIPVRELTEEEFEQQKPYFFIPFHLNKGPLFRFAVAKTDAAVHLLMVFHHLIFDGFSTNLFLKELGQALSGHAVEKEGASYFAYVKNQKRLLAGETREAYDAYFAELLADYDSATELAGDVNVVGDTGKKAIATKAVDAEAVARACRRTGVEEPAFFLAALDYTLSRLTASDQVYIATISSGRSDVRFADTFGMFVNTVPLAAKLPAISPENDAGGAAKQPLGNGAGAKKPLGNGAGAEQHLGNGAAAKKPQDTVDDYIRSVAEGLEEALEHENYPFAEIAANWGYSVNVMYEYQRGIVEKPEVPGLKAAYGVEIPDAKFGLTIRIVDQDGAPAIEAEYSDAVYSRELMDQFLTSYAIVLEKFAVAGRDKVRSVNLLDAEREKVLEAFREREPHPEIPADWFFHSGVEHWAEKTPDQTAIYAVDGTFTYKELDEQANRVAHALLARGIGRGDRVVLLLPRTARVFFALFGTLKAGAAYIPCDPNYPVERVRHIIDDSDARLVITTSDRLERFTDRPAVDVEELLKEQKKEKPEITITQEDLAYLIYTSGSTGKPKGVMLRHRGAVNYVMDSPGNILVHGMVERGHVLTAVTTLSFDFSIKEWAAPLYNGLTLSFAADDECNDAAKLAERMKKTGTDMFSSTPSRLLTLMESPEFRDALTNCRILINGGEKYPDKLLKELKEMKAPEPADAITTEDTAKPADMTTTEDTAKSADTTKTDATSHRTPRLMFNTYGPTEITVSSNTQELSGQDMVSAGRPLPNVIEYIVDTDGNLLPPGVVGELYIGGVGVAAGYNNLPEMTVEKFIEYNGQRVYKSGDYARWTKEGFVEILGRRDNQIKLRGLRIELDEVDAVLASQPGIGRTAVKIEKINGIEHLAAWFTADHTVDYGELKKELGRTLTNYMVPTAYMQLDEMPLTPNGKLDLKNLPLPELYRGERGEAASTQAEKDFAEIFSNLLHIEDVGAEENFFDLGGTSLLVTNVVIEAGKKGYRIAFGDVFDHPTPRALAALTGEMEAEITDGRVTVSRAGADRDGGHKTGPKSGWKKGSGDARVTDYDYTAIDDLLSRNTLENYRKGSGKELGNVLLTGATGYLGVHVLHEFLIDPRQKGKIYCMLRGGTDMDAKQRLVSLYFYYFDYNILELVDDRVFILDGDVTDLKTIMATEDKHIDTVINCAAVVKHFASGTLIEDVNLGGAENLVEYCLKVGAMLIQTSTMSVVSAAYAEDILEGYVADERSLYFRQQLENKYVHSKFLAERAVLEAVAKRGLKGKVMRFGNLAPRHADGEFQINFETNSAMGRLKAFSMLGCAAYDQLDATMEFSPIDAVARAVILLSGAPDDCTVFHVFNNQGVTMETVFSELSERGLPIRYVEREEFGKIFAEAQNDKEKAEKLTSIMAYMPGVGRQAIRLKRNCEYTMQVLYRLGFRWPNTTWDYIDRFVSMLGELTYFEEMPESLE